jgi:hypothetical protein
VSSVVRTGSAHKFVVTVLLGLLGALVAVAAIEGIAALATLGGMAWLHDVAANTGPIAAVGGGAAAVGAGAGGTGPDSGSGEPLPKPPDPPSPPHSGGPDAEGPPRPHVLASNLTVFSILVDNAAAYTNKILWGIDRRDDEGSQGNAGGQTKIDNTY